MVSSKNAITNPMAGGSNAKPVMTVMKAPPFHNPVSTGIGAATKLW
jgi:hypothetical protein